MRRGLLLAIVLLTACAAHTSVPQACSDPLRLYTDARYQPCCLAHDAAYARGGQEADRLSADIAFGLCLIQHGGTDDAESMFLAVRLGGWSRFTYKE